MVKYATNQERTAEYLKRFDREKTLKFLLPEQQPVIFDVGANDGASLSEFKGWWPDSRIHCFEPQEECWAALDQLREKYGRDQVFINKLAVGTKPNDQATFYTHDISTGISGFNKVNLQSLDSVHLQKLSESGASAVNDYEKTVNHARTVSVVRLDDYIANAKLDRVNLLKIDTQGFEPEVLGGFGNRLSDVDVVMTELMFYDYYERSLSFSDIEQFLIPAGFRLYDISHIAKNPMNGRTDWVDVIYVNNRVRVRA